MSKGTISVFKDYDSVDAFIRENKLNFERRKDRANTIIYMVVDYFTKFRMEKGYEPIGVEALADSGYESVTVTASYKGNDVSASFKPDNVDGLFEAVVNIIHALLRQLSIKDGSILEKEDEKKLTPIVKPKIEKVIYNGPATIVFWNDHTKTVSKCMKSDTYDREKGLAIAMAKKMSEEDFKRFKEDEKFNKYSEPSITEFEESLIKEINLVLSSLYFDLRNQ